MNGPFRGNPQPEWMLSLRKGDVLRSPNGDFRVVRRISRYSCGSLRCVTFVIRQCSWTTRCVTVYSYNDLKQMRYYPAGVRVRLDRDIDKMIEQSIKEWDTPSLKCCQVIGVVP